MKAACIGNMNNNMFSLARHLRDRGVDAEVLLFKGEPAHFHPSNDSFTSDYQAFTRQLEWGNPYEFLNFSAATVERSLRDYDFLIGCGEAPAFLSKAGRALDVFVPYGLDITVFPFPILHLNPRRLLHFSFFSRHQKAGISRAAAVNFAYTNPDWDRGLKRLKIERLLSFLPPILYDPIYAPNVIAKHYAQSAFYKDFMRIRDAFDFVVFHPCRHLWTREDLRPVSYKGNDILIRGFAQFLGRAPRRKACLVLVEYGADVAATKRLIDDLGIGEHVRWFPIMARKDVMIAYSLFDAGAGEPGVSYLTGGVIAECLASGKPLIQRRDDELYKEHGALYPMVHADSVDSIAAGLQRAMDDPAGMKEIGARAREWYLEHLVRKPVEAFTGLIKERFPRQTHACAGGLTAHG